MTGRGAAALNMIWTAARTTPSGAELAWLLTGTEGQTFISTVLSVMSTEWYDGGKVSKCSGHFRGTALQDIYDTIFC